MPDQQETNLFVLESLKEEIQQGIKRMEHNWRSNTTRYLLIIGAVAGALGFAIGILSPKIASGSLGSPGPTDLDWFLTAGAAAAFCGMAMWALSLILEKSNEVRILRAENSLRVLKLRADIRAKLLESQK